MIKNEVHNVILPTRIYFIFNPDQTTLNFITLFPLYDIMVQKPAIQTSDRGSG